MSSIGVVLPTQASLNGIELGQGSWELESWLSQAPGSWAGTGGRGGRQVM